MEHRQHVLSTRTFISRPRSEVFAFFSNAENLEQITPPQLHFAMITPTPIRMRAGAIIEYHLRLLAVPIYWKTRIIEWNPDSSFVDEQLAGPYAEWIHTHSFREVDGGTEMTDVVRYRLPLYPFGELAHPLVAMQLNHIFAFRAHAIAKLLGAPGVLAIR